MKRILITGGAGCLGSNLTERCLEEGHDILVLDNFATGHRGSLPNSHPKLSIMEGTITDRALVDRLFAEFKPSHVIHSAAAYKDPDDWLEDARTNTEGTIQIVEAAKAAGVERFVNFHTALWGMAGQSGYRSGKMRQRGRSRAMASPSRREKIIWRFPDCPVFRSGSPTSPVLA
jgi:nucleoside-diphosphate-sugar epimerase